MLGQELLHLPGQILVELFRLTVAAEAARHESQLQPPAEDGSFFFIFLVVTAAAGKLPIGQFKQVCS